MRYAIFSTYRTASTQLHDMVRNHFNITGLGELTGNFPRDISSNDIRRHQYLNERISDDNYVVKLFSSDFAENNYWFDKKTFDWSRFEKIIISTRSNITNQLASVYYMTVFEPGVANLFPINHTPKAIDFSNEIWMNIMEFMRESLLRFHDIKLELLETYPEKVSIIPSELFDNTPTEYLPIINSLTGIPFLEADLTPTDSFVTGLNYSEKYTNYNNLKEIVDSWGIPD